MLLPFLLSDRMGFFFPQKQGNCLDDKTVSNVQCHGHQKKTPQQQPSATDLRSACKEIDPKWLVNIFAECIMHHSGRRRSGENAKEEAKIRTTQLMRCCGANPLSPCLPGQQELLTCFQCYKFVEFSFLGDFFFHFFFHFFSFLFHSHLNSRIAC